MPNLDYETVPYVSRAISATAPGALALVRRAAGGQPPDLAGSVRVLEIGCGDGANLLPLAFHHPDWSFLGIDTSPSAIRRAQTSAASLGLEGVRFECTDLVQLARDAHFDFVIAHGVYSWIDAATRASFRELVSRGLSDDGLAYVSFNALPAWGVRGRVRDTLTRLAPETLAAARARVDGLEMLTGEPENAWTHLLANELARVRVASDAYLAHEYLAKDNAAFWLGDVVRDFASVGLAYVGDALFDRPEGWVDPAVRQRVAELEPDPIRREETIDLLEFRQMRAAVFARSENGAAPGASLVNDTFIAGVLRRRSDPFDLSPGIAEPFDGPRGNEVRVERSIAKVALLLLADRYPEGLTFDDLVERARRQLREHGIAPERNEAEAIAELRAGLYHLFEQLEIELRCQAPPLRVAAGPRPRVTALSRFEAARGAVLTSPLHTGVPLEPIDRVIIEQLDGTKSPEECAESITDAVLAGELDIEGAPSGRSRLAPLLEERVATLLATLGWWGLLAPNA